MEERYQLITKVYGTAESESIRLFLEAAGINVMLAQESAGKSLFPVSIGKMAQVKIFVREGQAEEAVTRLKEMIEGKYSELPDFDQED